MFTIKREICTNKGDKSKFSFARIMPFFGLKSFSEKAATAGRWHPHAVFLLARIVRRCESSRYFTRIYFVRNLVQSYVRTVFDRQKIHLQ